MFITKQFYFYFMYRKGIIWKIRMHDQNHCLVMGYQENKKGHITKNIKQKQFSRRIVLVAEFQTHHVESPGLWIQHGFQADPDLQVCGGRARHRNSDLFHSTSQVGCRACRGNWANGINLASWILRLCKHNKSIITFIFTSFFRLQNAPIDGISN